MQAPAIATERAGSMPALALGTWQLTGDDAVSALRRALAIGHRMIDTSGDYGNARELAAVLAEDRVPREELYVVSKVEEDEDTHAAAFERARELGLDRLDLCLLHRPPPDGAGVDLWRGLIRARDEGATSAIGVSSYRTEQIDELASATGEWPAVNQIEWSPFGHSAKLLEHHRAHGIVVQAYSPLTRGRRLGDPVIAEIAERHARTPGEVVLRWCVELGVVPVAKAARAEHLERNLAIFGFRLDPAEVEAISALNEAWSSLGGLPYV